jgi:hypothetical protein
MFRKISRALRSLDGRYAYPVEFFRNLFHPFNPWFVSITESMLRAGSLTSAKKAHCEQWAFLGRTGAN